ncbi:hypothetical protein LWI29_029102 [Acer saccharum]|uniref:Gnk2-homologous domain-containing protein n=1 Tax=Acer saccharum TaxID=4024 RepID=A0AA39W5J6_ACESA|nr:hypothetical protein LWI29_029102 [Acer saccharum]
MKVMKTRQFAITQGERIQYFRNWLRQVTRAVASAPNNRGYARAQEKVSGTGNESVYVLADCLRSLNASLCRACLENASASILNCLPWLEGRALKTGCFMRYSDRDFLNKELGNSRSRGVPGQHRGSNLPYDNGGELHQKERRRYRNGREGLSFEHSVGGKGSRPNTDSVMHQRPLSECTETALQPPSGRQVGATVETGQTTGTLVGTQVCSVSIPATRDTVFGGTSSGRGEDNKNREQLSGEDLRFALSLANGHPPPLTGRSLTKPSRSTSRGTTTRTPRPPGDEKSCSAKE